MEVYNDMRINILSLVYNLALNKKIKKVKSK